MKNLIVLLFIISVSRMLTGCSNSNATPPIPTESNTSTISSTQPTSFASSETTNISTNKITNRSSTTEKSIISAASTSKTTTEKSIASTAFSKQSKTSRTATKGDKQVSNCKLIVNGKELSSKHYIYLHKESQNIELPITAIFKALGAEVKWQGKTVIITHNNETLTLDTEEVDFGLLVPPGSRFCVRKVVDSDIIIDRTTAAGILYHGMGANIKVNYDEKTVEITN